LTIINRTYIGISQTLLIPNLFNYSLPHIGVQYENFRKLTVDAMLKWSFGMKRTLIWGHNKHWWNESLRHLEILTLMEEICIYVNILYLCHILFNIMKTKVR
jgi:hypothetical protein